MRYIIGISVCLLVAQPVFAADILPLDEALRTTYRACIDIDDAVSDLKTWAGIGTASSAVATAAGVGAVATGVAKSSIDKQIDEIIARLSEQHKNRTDQQVTEAQIKSWVEQNQRYADDLRAIANGENTSGQSVKITERDLSDERDKLMQKSKKLGNWRTGLLATNTATNVLGAVASGINWDKYDISDAVKSCVLSIEKLRRSVAVARIENQDVSEAEKIITACADYEFVDTSKISKRALGGLISSASAAAVGLSGTIVSGVANNEKNRNARHGTDDSAAKTAKNLNTAANALSVGTTAMSLAATIFNATQISAIKRVAVVSEKCTEALR